MDRKTAEEIAQAHGGDRLEEWIDLVLLGAQIGAEEERKACAKRLNDRANELRAKQSPHIYEEKAQILDYAAELVRFNPPAMSTRPWYDKSMELVRRHNLGFLHNPGGGQFTNSEKGINIQVSAMDDLDDYKTLLRGLKKLGLEPETPNAK